MGQGRQSHTMAALMKIYLILMIVFADGTPTMRTVKEVPNMKWCVGSVWTAMIDQSPWPKFEGHPVKIWSAGCMIGEPGEPT